MLKKSCSLNRIVFHSASPAIIDRDNPNVSLLALALGLLAMVTQLGLVRITAFTFYGNELTICIAIGNWLLWTGIGSLWGRRLAQHFQKTIHLIIIGTGYAIIVLATVYALTLSRPIWGLTPSEVVGVVPIWLWTLFIFSFPGIINGLFFPTLVQWLQSRMTGYPVKNIYIAEVMGSAIGGIFFASLVVLQISTFLIIHLSVTLLALAIGFLLITRKRQLIYIFSLLTVCFISAYWGIPALVQYKWKPMPVLKFVESPYQTYTMIAYGDVKSLYGDSEPIWTYGDRERSEELVHFGLLNHPNPRSILIIGYFNSDIAFELCQYPSIQQVTYVQMDKILLELTKKMFRHDSLCLPVKTITGDPIEYLSEISTKYDIVLLNVPLPTTASWNRFYTREFYRMVEAHLNPEGLMTLSLPGGEEYFTAEESDFLKSIDTTLATVFRWRNWIPGLTVHLLAGNRPLYGDLDFISEQLIQRGIKTHYVNVYYLKDRLAPSRRVFLYEQLAKSQKPLINSRARPIGYYFDTILWDQRTGGWIKNIYRGLHGIGSLYSLGVLVIALGVLSMFARKSRANLSVFTIFGIGFMTMSLESVFLILYQSYVGSLYFHLVFLTFAYMSGSMLGAYLFQIQRQRKRLYLILVLMLGLPFLGLVILGFKISPILVASIIGLALFSSGMLVGYSFLLLTAQAGDREGEALGRIAGRCYAADIGGATLGVFLVAIIIIPIYGLPAALILNLVIGLVLLIANLFAGKMSI